MPGSSEKAAAGPRIVVQLARLGDFLQTTPLLACLARDHPGDTLAGLVTPAQEPLARACGVLDRLLVLDPHIISALAGSGAAGAVKRAVLGDLLGPFWQLAPREVYNLNLSPLSASVAAGFSGARMIGWRAVPNGEGLVGEGWSPFVTAMVADRRLTRLHLCDILVSYADPRRPPEPRLLHRPQALADTPAAELLPAGDGPLVALQPGANNDLRRWPIDHFARLAAGLLEAGARVMVVGAAFEQPLAQRLISNMGPDAGRVADLMGRTDLASLGALLASADLVVSGDTGTLHLATAAGAPTLSLFMGPAQVHETGPYQPGHLILQARDDCGPCWEASPPCQGKARCRRLIAPPAALQAALALLNGRSAMEAAAELDLPQGVEALTGEADSFGLRYRLLRPREQTTGDALALALREAGRVLLRTAYQSDPEAAAGELSQILDPPRGRPAAETARLAAAARRMAIAVADQDRGGVLSALGAAPALKPLTAAAGGRPPARLAEACQAAAGVMEAMASR